MAIRTGNYLEDIELERQQKENNAKRQIIADRNSEIERNESDEKYINKAEEKIQKRLGELYSEQEMKIEEHIIIEVDKKELDVKEVAEERQDQESVRTSSSKKHSNKQANEINFSTYKELLNKKEEIENQLTEFRQSHRLEAINETIQLINDFKLTKSEVFKSNGKKKVEQSKAKGEAKYRDPISKKEWTGKGPAPSWMPNDAEGRKAFLIKPQESNTVTPEQV